MTKTAANVFIPSSYSVWTAPYGSTPPTSPTAAPSASFYEIGFLSDQGITEGRNINETSIRDLVGALVAVARNQEERPFTFQALEDNRVVRELRYPNSALSTASGTSEVQTLTVTATGGTMVLSGGYGGTGTTGNITAPGTSAGVQTAIRTLPGFSTVNVTGSSGGPYTITFPASVGDVAQLTVDTSALTGGSATLATTTPGVAPINTRHVGAAGGQNLRVYLIYVAQGNKHNLFVVRNGEATQTGTVGRTSSGAAVSEFQLQPYIDTNGYFFDLLDDDPAQSVSYA